MKSSEAASRVRRQRAILTERYVEILAGDLRAVALLLIQAPIIALLVVGVWSNVDSDTRSLYFVLALSAFFLGSVNSAREIVKERDIFLRERMCDLSCRAYVESKLFVLSLLGVVQCAALTAIVAYSVPLKVNVFLVALLLVCVSLAGTSVGLLISAWSKTDDRAVMMVPLVVIPQILFSDFVLSGGKLENWTGVLQRVMPVHWVYSILEREMTGRLEWDTSVAGAIALLLVAGLSYGLTIVRLEHTTYST